MKTDRKWKLMILAENKIITLHSSAAVLLLTYGNKDPYLNNVQQILDENELLWCPNRPPSVTARGQETTGPNA